MFYIKGIRHRKDRVALYELTPRPPNDLIMIPCWNCKGFPVDDNGTTCEVCKGRGMVAMDLNPMIGMNPSMGN